MSHTYSQYFSSKSTASSKLGEKQVNPLLSGHAVIFCMMLLMVVVFFISSNPYVAGHGAILKGKLWIKSETSLPTQFVMPIVFVIYLLYYKRLYLDFVILTAAIFMLISGALTGILFQRPQTYFLDIINLFFVSSCAYFDARRHSNFKQELNLTAIFLAILVPLGLIAAFLFPNKYGLLYWAFSRQQRSEVSLWIICGLEVLLPAFVVIAFESNHKFKWILGFLYLCYALVTITTSRRTWTYEAFLMPLLTYLIYSRLKTNASRIITNFLIALTICTFSPFIGNMFLLRTQKDNTNIDASLNGRGALWSYYYNAYLESPLWGKGAFLLENVKDYKGEATSEIGILKDFAEYGFPYSIILCISVLSALIVFIIFVIQYRQYLKSNINLLYCGTILVCCFPIFCFEGMSRIYGIPEYVFWYSVLYINYSYRRVVLEKNKLRIPAGIEFG